MHDVDVELVRLAVPGRESGHRGRVGARPVGPVPADLEYAVQRVPLPAGSTPDATARALCPPGVEVLHSTSWRHEPSGRLVLTYAAGPAPGSDMTPLVEPSVVCSGDPLTPAPPDVHAHHVAAHAARHLADLATRDPGVAAAAATGAAEFWAALSAASELPTGTHTDVHARAHARSAAPAGRD